MTTNKLQKRNEVSTPARVSNERDTFLTPFDRMFDDMVRSVFPNFDNFFGVSAFERNAYPKVDIKDYSDKVVINAEIPGLQKEKCEGYSKRWCINY